MPRSHKSSGTITSAALRPALTAYKIFSSAKLLVQELRSEQLQCTLMVLDLRLRSRTEDRNTCGQVNDTDRLVCRIYTLAPGTRGLLADLDAQIILLQRDVRLGRDWQHYNHSTQS